MSRVAKLYVLVVSRDAGAVPHAGLVVAMVLGRAAEDVDPVRACGKPLLTRQPTAVVTA